MQEQTESIGVAAGALATKDGRHVSLSEAAAARIKHLISLEEGDDLFLRLAVSGGGCSGFSYGFSFDNTKNDDDHIFTRDNVDLVIDDVSLDLLAGAEVDFVDDLIGASFQVKNPNASSSCGCGTSFAV